MKGHLFLAFVLCVVASLCGCGGSFVVGAAATAGGVVYHRGALREDLDVSLDKVWDASLRAVKDMKLTVREKTKDGLAGMIEAERADGRDVKIVVKALPGKRTGVAIRIGVVGDRDGSEIILEAIKDRLR